MRIDVSMAQGPVLLSELGQSWWKGCIYGPPGAGKTCFATISNLYNTFVFDVDCGVNTTMARRKVLNIRYDNCLVWIIRSTQDFIKACEWLATNINRFQLIVVDSATELQRVAMHEVNEKRKSPTIDQRDWGILRTQMEDFTVWLRYLPTHVVYVCHEQNKWDPTLNQNVWRPSFDGRFAFEYAKHFSYIARLMTYPVPTGQNDPQGQPIVNVQRLLAFGPDPYIHYKDRSGCMRQWEYPDLDAILQRMINSTTVETVQEARR